MKKLITLAGLLASLSIFSGCIGDTRSPSNTFGIIKKVYDTNLSITDNRWVNEVLFVIPGCICYGIGGLLDIIVFNSIHFWTNGNTNPVAFSYEGVEYIASQNVDGTVEVTNQETGEKYIVSYDEESSRCTVTQA